MGCPEHLRWVLSVDKNTDGLLVDKTKQKD